MASEKNKEEGGDVLVHISSKRPPSHLDEMRTHITIGEDFASNSTGFTHPDAFASIGIDGSFRMSHFQDEFDIRIEKLDEKRRFMQFEMNGIDTSIANALRRILLSEVCVISSCDDSHSKILHPFKNYKIGTYNGN